MNVPVRIFYPELQRLLNNRIQITVAGSTVGECLNDLLRRYPEAKSLIFNEKIQLFGNVFVFINAESSQKAAFSAPLKEGDEIILAMLAIGG